ncbi:hypothetical protein OA84_05715 [Kaistella solincola]|uniref:Menorin-like domain-containing protein n=2 Tax=Kaistella solincola TaxID=510955 RepID=A0ABR4ZPT9_9FLAO|nr:hypothetical protein OA84_05715 [Kaistella solincola]
MLFFKCIFTSKIWAHRVNSIEKFEEARKKFPGVELDLVFDSVKNNFDVNHPPANSIDLNLFDYLNSNKNYKNLGLWLDFKNLNVNNKIQSSVKLDSIVRTLSIETANIIVESNTPNFLNSFKSKGFKTSYYLPWEISSLKNEELSSELTFINNLIISRQIDYISSDVIDYKFMKEKFPYAEIITWIIDNPAPITNLYTFKVSVSSFIRNLKVLSDEDVKVVLFGFKAKAGNR